MKQTRHILLTIATLLCSLAASAHNFEAGGIYYNITSSTDLTVAVTYLGNYYDSYSNEYSGAVTIPETVTYNNNTYSVTRIGNYTFRGCSSLTAITIPEGVTSIGDDAFSYCSSLTDITIPESVTSIGDDAFSYCSSLADITIPESVTSIGSDAFDGTPWYNNQPDGVVYIGKVLYEYKGTMPANTAIEVKEGTVSINPSAFSGCSSLTSITIPEGVMSIGYNAFFGCSSLESINIPEGVTSIGSSTFYGCSSLESITIPENVTSIGNYAFDNCTALKKVIIEDGGTTLSLGYNFYYSDGGQGLFYDCPLEEVYLGRNLSYYSLISYGNSPFYKSNGVPIVTLGNRVTAISSCLFYGNTNLTFITIPESVTSIGSYAFSGCSSLTTITLPKNVTSIGDCAFDNCTALKKVIIEDGGTTLSLGYNFYYSDGAQGLFYDCPLEEVYLGRNLSYSSGSSYGYSPFYKSNGVPIVTLGNSVTTISPYLFYGNTNLTSITIPENVTSIGNYAFDNCTALKKVIIEDGGTTLSLGYSYYSSDNQGLFYDCPLEVVYLGRNLSYYNGSSYGYSPFYKSNGGPIVTLGNSVTTISPYLFYGNTNLTSITIPESVTSIGNSAFEGCSSLTFTTIPESVTSIGSYAFSGCSGNLTVNCNIPSYSSNYSAFYNSKFSKVTIGNKVTSIGAYAFSGCNNLSSVTIGNGVLSIGSNAFSTPDKVIWLTNTPPTGYANAKGDINYVANDQYTSLSNVKVYPYLSSLFEVDGVKYVPVSPSERTCHAIDCAYDSTATIINVGETASFKGVAMKVTEVMPYTFCENNYIEEVFIAHSGNIGDCAFYNCSSLNAITLGDSIGSLGSRAFYQCTNLPEIVVPNSIKVVGEYCFTGCSSLTNVELGNSVATINNYAFQNCSSLSEICIPQSTNTIGDYAFYGCSQLANVIIEDRTTALSLGSNDSSPLFASCPLDSVYIGGKITYSTTSSKGYSPFYRNTSLCSVVITDREEQIYDNEFYGCTNLQNVTIGNGVKSIGNYAFSGCSSLAGFSFGSSMESIGDEAFSDCTSLTSITSHAAVPPTCGTQALDDINKWNCSLRVPSGYAAAYQAADQWKDFFFIEDVVEVDHYVLTYVVDGEVVHTEVLKHKDEVTMLAEPTKVGYEFSGWDKTLTTMPAEDVIISGTFTRLPVDNLVILDTEENFLIDEEMECETVTYTRHFDDTQWQALYLPFAIPYDSLYKEFEVAYINDMHQFDDDNNGTIDRTEVEAIKIVEGMLKANYPYLIKAKSIGEKSIVVADATLYATEENSVDCSSVFTNYTFTGSYSTLSGEELAHDEGYYVLSDGMWQPLAEGASLGAFRIYLKIESRDGNNAVLSQAAIRMRVVGDKENEDDATGIENSTGNGQQATVYDLQGRKVLNTDNLKGIYIVDGKKVVIK